MKKTLLVLLASVALLLSSCLETAQSTTINEDGSGMMLLSADMSGFIKTILKEDDDIPKDMPQTIDTTIYFRDFLNKVDGLTSDQKRLAKEMMLKPYLKMNGKDDIKFMFNISGTFGNLDDLNAMQSMIREPEFGALMNKALSGLPGFDADEEEGKAMEMMMFTSIPFFTTTYQKGKIECVVDTSGELYKGLTGDEKLKTNLELMETSHSKEFEMLKNSTFTTVITLPSGVKEIKGAAGKGASDREIVVKGNLVGLFKDPKQYEYSVSY